MLSNYNMTGQWMILQLNRGSNKAQGLSFMHMDSASTDDRHSLMSGFGTQMASPIRAKSHKKSTDMHGNEKKHHYSMRILHI